MSISRVPGTLLIFILANYSYRSAFLPGTRYIKNNKVVENYQTPALAIPTLLSQALFSQNKFARGELIFYKSNTKAKNKYFS
jgi:hypothetical protein